MAGLDNPDRDDLEEQDEESQAPIEVNINTDINIQAESLYNRLSGLLNRNKE